MSGDVHVRICERLGVRFPRATRLVIVCRRKKEAERALEMVRWIMGKLKLTLHPTKTHLVDWGKEGFEFLGFHFPKRMVRKTGKLLPYYWPGQKAMKAVRSKIRQIAGYSGKRLPMERIGSELNPVVRGWRNYFSVGNSTKQLQALDHYLWLRTRRSFLSHHQGTRGRSKSVFFPSWFARSGVEHFYLLGLCGNDFERSRKKDNR
jgi:RNA-directed DNA polymerase